MGVTPSTWVDRKEQIPERSQPWGLAPQHLLDRENPQWDYLEICVWILDEVHCGCDYGLLAVVVDPVLWIVT